MLNIRDAVRTLFGQGATTEQIQAELDNFQVDSLLERLSREGHLAADPEVREIAAIFARQDPKSLERLLIHPRPAPVVSTTYTPPAAALDTTEQAIQDYMQTHNVRYAEAALAITSKQNAE